MEYVLSVPKNSMQIFLIRARKKRAAMDKILDEFWVKLVISIICGSIVGIERQIKGKPSGIRTSIFICLGTNIFISLGVANSNPNADITRVLGQVVTGIGFLGAGVIISREGLVLGITSAAVI